MMESTARERYIGRPMTMKEMHRGVSKRKQVLSKGRNKPMPPQSAIIVNCMFLKNEMAMRRKASQNVPEDELLAPLGTEECFRCRQGELCFEPIYKYKATNGLARLGPNPVTDVACSSTVNGYRRGTELRFIGWVATDMDVPDFHRDEVGAVQVVGTCSTINTGPETIPAMSNVYFCEEPYVLYGANGKKVPGVLEVGQPGAEDRSNSTPAKYKPSLYAMTDDDLASIVVQRTRAAEEYALKADSANNGGGGDGDRDIRTLANEICAAVLVHDPPSMPLKALLVTHIVQLSLIEKAINIKSKIAAVADERMRSTYTALSSSSSSSSSLSPPSSSSATPPTATQIEELLKGMTFAEDGKVIEMLKLLQDQVIEPMLSERSEYDSAIGDANANISQRGPLFEMLTEKGWKKRNIGKFLTQLQQLRDYCVIMIRRWLENHMIGVAINTCESGGELHLNLRCRGSS